MDQIYGLIKQCWASENLLEQANGVSLVTSLCEIVDYEDIDKMLKEFLSSIF